MRILAACVALIILVPASARADDPLPSLERAMLSNAGKLIKIFTQRAYGNVGVLKFKVGYENDPKKALSDSLGTANLLLARRLQIALELTNTPKKPIGIIDDASAIVAKEARGANHFGKDEQSRKKLFTLRYPLAWGNKQVSANAFVSGEALICKDQESMKLRLYVLDAETLKLTQEPEEFRVALNAGNLAEVSDCYIYRGVVFGPVKPATPAKETAPTPRTGELAAGIKAAQDPMAHLATRQDVPVRLNVYYGDERQHYQIKQDSTGRYRAYLPKEPAPGQKVSLEMVRDKGDKTYGVVLQVNGENTIDREHKEPYACRKWLLGPEQGPAVIRGYLVDKQMYEFKGLTAREEKEQFGDGFNYGEDLGTITMSVFPPAGAFGANEPVATMKSREKALAISAGAPTPPAENFNALLAKLLNSSRPPDRGYIGAGAKLNQKAEEQSFDSAHEPIMVLTIVYAQRDQSRERLPK
jgi:hypothetical protein